MIPRYSTSNLIKTKEPTIDNSLTNLNIAFSSKNISSFSIKQLRQYYDEPKFWQYSATLNNLPFPHNINKFDAQGSGFSFFFKKLALLKCLSETVERYCNFLFSNKFVDFTGTYLQIKNSAISPTTFSSFSTKQLQKKVLNIYALTRNQYLGGQNVFH